MLLEKRDYLRLCNNVDASEKSFVFAYLLDISKEKIMTLKTIADKMGCEVKLLSAKSTHKEDTIEKWLANFRDASFIVTDSYHGTVFSILFEKEFICFYNEKRGNSRMDSLRKIANGYLDDRFISVPNSIPNSNLNYNEISENVYSMRKKSIEFLKNSLA